ncbi:MAG: DUF2271 domain-containing protein [candidate division WOR-3 bacterium]|nr:MAG: DUF2271 domain-containing protein [candidate division WOR-3 bacterium]
MKRLTLCSILLAIIAGVNLHAVTLEEYINEAQQYQDAYNLEQAITTMEQAVREYPDSSTAYTQLGILIGEKAQRTRDFTAIIAMISRVFEMWDKAIALDPNNVEARFNRGAWGVSIPKSSGQLEKGIDDLGIIIKVLEQSPDEDVQAQLAPAYYYLGTGYRKKWEFQKAKQMYEKVVELIPDTEEAQRAQSYINKITLFETWQYEQEQSKKPDSPEIIELKENLSEDPQNIDLLITLGKAYFDAEKYLEAEQVLEKAIRVDTMNAQAYKLLALTLNNISGEYYDPRISIDTDFRTDLVFETMAMMDKAVALAPDDIELRLMRGTMGVSMPFFAGTLDQGIADLQMILESDASADVESDALYWLGRAHQKKAMTYWIKVVSEYSESAAADFVFNTLSPGVKHIELGKLQTPVMVIEFVLGFRDELAPQTAVWVEDKKGNFVKTIYVSGFSGYTKSTQVNLPVWAQASEFIDADAVTGASIDLGHHIYTWNLKDVSGKRIKHGDYVVKAEVAYWPSMQYQRVEAPVTLARKPERIVIEEGRFIPYLEIKYLP